MTGVGDGVIGRAVVHGCLHVLAVTQEAFDPAERFVRPFTGSNATGRPGPGRSGIPARYGRMPAGVRLPGRRGPYVADHGAQRPGHVHPGPFGLSGSAAGPPAQSGCPAQLREPPLSGPPAAACNAHTPAHSSMITRSHSAVVPDASRLLASTGWGIRRPGTSPASALPHTISTAADGRQTTKGSGYTHR
jgi:hypothetical protein